MPAQLGLVLLIALAAGCASTRTAPEVASNDITTFNGASIEIVAEGGIAALSVTDRVDHDSRAFAHVMRHLCDKNCAAPLDTASGTLSAATVDSLFNGVLAQKITFQDDYGTTRNAADMQLYTVRITSNGSTKTIRADDGTMPGALHQVVDATRGAIVAARR